MACPYHKHRMYPRFSRWSCDERAFRPMDYGARMWRRRQRWAARCKNALQQLNELKPGLEYRVVSQTGPCHRPVFVVHVQLSGQVGADYQLSMCVMERWLSVECLLSCRKLGPHRRCCECRSAVSSSVKPCPHCRRKVRLSQKTATVAHWTSVRAVSVRVLGTNRRRASVDLALRRSSRQ